MDGADLRRQVAMEVARMTHVRRQHAQDILAHHAAVVEPKGRQPQPFMPDLAGRGVVGAVGRAADIAVMRPVDRPEYQLIAVENRHEGGDIRQMAAAEIRIVEQEHVARMHVVAEELDDRFGRPGQRPDMDGDMFGLRHQDTVGAADRGREVAARIQDLRIGGPQHGLAHLLDDGAEPVLNDGDGDRVDGVRGLWVGICTVVHLVSFAARP